MGDRVEAAIAAVEDPQPAPRATVRITLASGRDILVQAPADLAALELVSVIGYLASPTFFERLAEARGVRPPGSLVPHHLARG